MFGDNPLVNLIDRRTEGREVRAEVKRQLEDRAKFRAGIQKAKRQIIDVINLEPGLNIGELRTLCLNGASARKVSRRSRS